MWRHVFDPALVTSTMDDRHKGQVFVLFRSNTSY